MKTWIVAAIAFAGPVPEIVARIATMGFDEGQRVEKGAALENEPALAPGG